MDLAGIEVHKARAVDAWQQGALEDADALLDVVVSQYARHGFEEGLLALCYNQLLIALEMGGRPRIATLMSRLCELLREAPPSPTTIEVATRICDLFAEPFPGVNHQTTAALVALAADRARAVEPPRPDAPGPDEIPGADALARLHPLDAALVLTWLARVTRGRPGLPDWLRAVQSVVGEAPSLDPDARRALQEFQAYAREDDVFRGYPALVAVFEAAARTAPELACELAVGLASMEESGLPERLRYTPGLPEEQRLRSSIDLHGRLAAGLSKVAGAERLARGQWRAMAQAADAWLALARHRGERGGARAEDAEHEAMASVWRARASRALGALDEAARVLARSLARARRQAFDGPYVAALVIREAADVAERRGRREEAAGLYAEAAELALPGIAAAEDDPRRVELVDEVTAESGALRVALAADALAGEARCRTRGPALVMRLEAPRLLLTVVRPLLDVELYGRACLAIELSAARAGCLVSAHRALEAAHALQDRAGVALALLYRGLEHAEGADPKQRGDALDDLARAAAEARRAAAGAVRRTVETAVALTHLGSGEGTDKARVEIHLRRAAEADEGMALADGAGSLDVLLPEPGRFELEVAVRRVVERGNAPLARRLCAAGRRRAQRVPLDETPGPLADGVRTTHCERFTARWIEARPVRDEAVVCSALLSDRAGLDWAGRAPDPHTVWLEYRLFDDWLVGFAVSGDGLEMHHFPISRRWLAGRVEAYMDVLNAGGPMERRWFEGGLELVRLLVAPWVESLRDARRVVILPDGPLCDLAFASLWDGHGFLAQRFDLAVSRPAAAPTFDDASPPAPPAALIVGDFATGRDLRVSTLVGEGQFESVDTRLGADLGPAELTAALTGARVVHLVGALTADAGLTLAEDAAPTPLYRVAEALGGGGAVCATLMGPAGGDVARGAAGTLLAGLRGGVLVRHWTGNDEDLLLDFLAGAARAGDASALIDALGHARRACIEAGVQPRDWAGYELYLAER